MMNKSQLTDAIVEKTGFTKADAERALNAVIDSITSELVLGKIVQLVGFGSLSVSPRKARTGRNPKTGEQITIGAKNIIKFKASNKLEEAVN